MASKLTNLYEITFWGEALMKIYVWFILPNTFFLVLSLGGSLSSNEIREIFALFDKSNKGQVATNELGTLVRALNLNPTETEITEMQSRVDPKGKGSFNLDSLEQVV